MKNLVWGCMEGDSEREMTDKGGSRVGQKPGARETSTSLGEWSQLRLLAAVDAQTELAIL